MALERKTPGIRIRMRRVELDPRAVEELCIEMEFNGTPIDISADQYTAQSWADLSTFPGATIRELTIYDSKDDLRVSLTPEVARVTSVGTPSPTTRTAAARIEQLLRSHRKNAVFNRSLAFIYLIQLVATMVVLGGFFIWRPEGPYALLFASVAAAQVVVAPLALWLNRKFEINPPPVVLRRDGSFVRRWGLEIGLALTVLSIVVTVVIAIVD